ncbi:hypothetical protein HU200_003928 [Digitaria exilis]|uniref:C2H2-type domain-containing protein n=1 Tax=Digitaria exilis TaxID=1010633 RepID=A0A835KTY2_9POAL|nr:hypothetical protein HU200_003928 [Digitaria exilis]
MASPFLGTLAVIKVEDEENSGVADLGDQELRNKFWRTSSVGSSSRRGARSPLAVPSRRRRGLLHPHRSKTVQPPPPAPPAPPTHHSSAKRPAILQPPVFVGVRQPPTKQYQRRPPGQRARPQPPQQPAPPTNAQRAPGPPPVSAQRAPHAPVVTQPAPSACRALAPSGPGAMPPPPLQLVRSAPRPPPRHPAAKKKPTVPCAFCGVLCMTAWHLKQHEKGRRHRNKVAYLAGEVNVRCPVCNVHLSGALNVQQHYAGKQHLWRLKHGGA